MKGSTAKKFSTPKAGGGPKSFKSKVGGGTDGPGGHYDETPLGFNHSYGEKTAKSVVSGLHKHTRG